MRASDKRPFRSHAATTLLWPILVLAFAWFVVLIVGAGWVAWSVASAAFGD